MLNNALTKKAEDDSGVIWRRLKEKGLVCQDNNQGESATDSPCIYLKGNSIVAFLNVIITKMQPYNIIKKNILQYERIMIQIGFIYDKW